MEIGILVSLDVHPTMSLQISAPLLFIGNLGADLATYGSLSAALESTLELLSQVEMAGDINAVISTIYELGTELEAAGAATASLGKLRELASTLAAMGNL